MRLPCRLRGSLLRALGFLRVSLGALESCWELPGELGSLGSLLGNLGWEPPSLLGTSQNFRP